MASYYDYKSKLDKKYGRNKDEEKDKEEEKKPSTASKATSTTPKNTGGSTSTSTGKYESYKDRLDKKYGSRRSNDNTAIEGSNDNIVNDWLSRAYGFSQSFKPVDTSKYAADYGSDYKNTINSLLDESYEVSDYLRTHKDEIGNYDDILFSYDQLTEHLRSQRSYVDEVNNYYKQFYGEDHYNSTKMSLGELYTRMLVGEDSDEGRIAYTTPDGQNVTWKSLYELKKAEAEYDQLSAKPDWEEKSAALGTDSYTFGDGSLSDEDIIFELTRTTMPHSLDYALEDGYTEEQFNDIQAKREYISKKYGVDAVDNLYGEIKELGDLGNHFWYMQDMTDKEKAVFSYIYNTQGAEAAYEWVEPKTEAIKQRKYARLGSELGEEHPFWGSVLSVPVNIAGGVEYIADAVDYLITGEEQYNSASQLSSSIRGTVAQQVDWEIGNWDAFDFLYNTGMSMVDSMVSQALFGKFGGVIQGLSAAGQGVNDALDRGMSQSQAFWNGFFNGVFEGLFETVSIGQFGALKESVVNGGKSIAKNLAKTMLVNATEETATELANIAYDYFVNADFSQIETSIRQYMAQGMSESDAKMQVAKDMTGQVVEAGASGALMGFGFGVAGNAYGAHNYNQQATAEGNRVVSNGGVDALKALANDVAGVSNSNLTKLAGKVTSDQSKRNIKNVGKLSFGVDSARMEQNRADIKNELIKKGVSSLKAGKYADILVDMNSEFYRGESPFRLGTDKQWKQITGDKNAYSILRSIVTNEESSVNIRNLKHSHGRIGIATAESSARTAQNTAKAKAEGSVDTAVKSVLNGEIKASDDGKSKLDGDEVSINGIAEIKMEKADGKTFGVPYLKVVDAEGNESVVSSRDVEYGSKADAIVYESFAQMGLDPSYFDTYLGDLNAEGINKTDANLVGQFAIEYGLGVNIGSIGSKADLAKVNLSETSRTHAYESGESQTKANVEAQQSVRDKAVEERKASGKGKVRTQGKVHYDAKKINNKMRRAGLEFGKRIANLGIDVYFFESHQDAKGNFVDDNGNLADNGYYLGKDGSIHIDLNAGNNGEGIIAYTMSHELTHWMKDNHPKEFKAFADLIVKWYGKKGQSVSDLVSERMAEENLSWDDAFEEVIARSCESFLTDSNIAERIAELGETSPKALQVIKNWFRRFMNWVRSLYKDVDPQSAEGQLFHKWQNEIDEIYDAFFNTLKGASESFQWIGARDFSDVSDAKNTEGKTLFQHRAMEADKEAYRNMLIKHGVMTSSEITALFNTVDKALDIIKSNLEALDYAWDADIDDRAFSPVKPNSDSLYQVSLDFSTLCRKRILQQVIQAQLQEALNKQLSREESIAIRDELMKIQEEGRQIEIACALCYVESARMKSTAQITRFMENREAVIREFLASKSGGDIKQKIKQAELDARNKLGVGNESLKKMPKSVADQIRSAKKQAKKSYEPTADELKLIDVALGMSVSDFTSPQGLENLAKNYPVLFDAYTSYIRNATKSKGIENDTWFRAGDSATISDTLIANMNRENGLRSQSWSDFQVIHLLDYIAATIELSTRNAKEQAYSKVPDYIELMGKTGVMLNMSLIPTSDFNGTLRYDSTEGIDYNRSLELRDKYHETAGTICIGMGNGQIKLLLADGTIDYVIPYHKSGMAAHIRKLMHIPEWTDYEPYQSESTLSRSDAEKNAKKYGVKLLDESDPNYHKHTSFSEWFNLEEAKQIAKMENAYPSNTEAQKKYGVMYGGYMAMQNAANNYLKLCAERGIAPKFSHENADFTGEDNYWKLLIDRKMVDNVTGEIIEQKAIQPIFDEAEVLRILNDELERYPQIKADQEYATRKVVEKFLSGKMNDRLDADTIASIMQKPVDNVTVANIVSSSNQNDNVKHSSRKPIAKKRKTSYNEFATLAMRWANQANRQSGDTTILYDEKRKKFSLLEATEDGYLEVTAGRYEKVRSFYEQAHREADSDIHADSNQARTERGRGVWGLQPSQDGGHDVRYVGSSGGEGLQTDTAGDDEHLRSGDQGEPVKKSSRRDSLGIELTDAQQGFFKDSIVRDADGNLLVMYHGTPTGGFTTFEIPHYLSSLMSAQGAGFYFTDKKNAEQYMKPRNGKVGKNRQLYEVYLNITNPMEIDPYSTGHITDQQMRDIFARGNYEWGMNHTDVEKEIRINKLDSDRLASLVKVFNGGEILEVMKDVLGYDGVRFTDQYGDIWVAWDQSQIKNVDNLNPTEDPDIRYSRRGVSNRSLLATALDSATKNDIEKKRLNEYKGKIALIESEQQKLTDLRERIKELSFAPGTRDTVAIKKLQDAATRVANRINTYDRQLLNLEATAPLKAVLQREKEQVRKREKQKASEALSAYREKAAKTLREVMNRNTESRKKSVEGRKKTVVRNKIKRVVTDLRGLLNRGTKERNVKTDMQETVGSALKLANVIFNDVISNEDIVLMGATMATEEEQKLLDQYVDLIAKRDSSTADEALRYINKISTLNGKLADLFKRERARLNQAKVSEAVDELAKAYSKLKDSNKGYVNFAYNEDVHKRLMSLSESLAGTVVKDMSLSQLEEVYDAYKMILHMVRESNSLFRMGKTQDLAEAVTSVQDQILAYYKEREKDPRAGAKKLSDLLGKFAWNEMKPLTAFETLGSEAYTELFWDAIKAESEWARWMEESKAFLDEQRKKYGYKSWKMDVAHEFTLPDGKVFRLTLQDMMSIYAYSKRDQAQEHMTVGGFQFDKKNTYTDKDGKKRVRLGELYVTDWSTIGNIISELTNEQKQYVDAVQRYLTDMGKRGNEVSEILYGIGIFNEAEYFPLMSAKDYRSSVEEALNNTQTQVSLKNTGMTKQTVPHASNPIILQGFDDVVYGHIDKMAKYCTHVLPIENLRRVFDSVSADDNGDYVSTKAVIEKVFGENAKNYFDQYITDLNGGVFVDGAESPTMAMFSKFKGTSVGASLSVVVQQPFAVIRAMEVIGLKHFILGKVGKAETKHLYDEIKRYAPVAIIKEMGGFDVGSSRTAREHLGVRTDKGIKRVLDTVNDAAMWGAGKADELGWGIIWKAVKREVASENKYKPGTAEFYEACGERFTEVIVRTQVYDSVNSRSGYMRSKHELVKFATSFMGEPTTIINNAYLSILNTFRANGKAEKAKAYRKLGRTMGVLLSSTLLTTLAKSFVYAMRDDDDEDEALMERWAKHTGDNLGFWGDLNPLTMLPFARDIVSIFEGWDVERPDMTLIANVITSAKRLLDDDRKEGEEGSFTTVDEALAFIGDAANLFGVPLKNVIRDAKGIINVFGDITDDVKPTDMGGAFVSGLTGDEKSNTDALYDAIINGDTAKAEAIKKGYKDDKAVMSAIRKGLRDNDPRIKEAAKARYEGDIGEYMRIAKEIKAEGYFSQDDIVAAINAEINKLKPDKESEPSSPAVVTVADYYKAIVSGQTGTATSIKDELVAQKVAEGYTKAEAESSVESGFVTQVKTAYMEGAVGQSKAISLIDTYGGDDGEKKTKEWDFETDTGYTWSQRDNAYRLGAVSRTELISYIEDIEGKDRDEAENDVRVYEFRDEYPEYSAVSSDAIKKFYKPIKDKNYSIEDTGMDIGTYAEYALLSKDCKGVDNDGDGNADSGTKKAEIMRVINSLPITYQQKDALYFLNGWSASTLYQAPWR